MDHKTNEEKKRQAFRATCIRLKAYLAEKRLAREEQLYEEVSASTADIIEEGFEKLDAIQLEDLESAPSRMEDNKAEVQDPLLKINVGTKKDNRPLFVSALFEPKFQADLIKLLNEYKDYFAWSYEEMPGLSRKLVEHRLPIKKDFQPYKQPPRRMSSEVMLKIKEEIERLLKAGFIRTVRYVEWLSNVVPVMKKNGKLRVCVDFRNLNNATPKDEYPMPVADQLIDSADKHEILSFMDGHSGYNQIYLAEEDVHKTAFRCPGSIGTFEWIVMPFGLKNAGATYQRAMNSIFHDMIGRFMEIYIDDVVVKSSAKRQHLEHLKRAFERMRIHKLKMNPLKCAFGVSAGNFLGFLVHKRGIKVDQNKVKAIINARAPANKKQVQRFLGQVGFLRRFISNHAGRVHVFSTLVKLKSHEKFHWDESHQKAFDKIKEYLANPPVVMPPRKKWSLKLYLSAAEESIGSMLAQDNEHGKEQAVYYLSRILTDVECRYSSIEKLCLSLYYSAMKLRVYMRPVDVYILCQTNVIKYMLSRPLITGRIGKWALALMEFNFIYVSQKSVKGRVLADFLADHPSTDIDPWVYDELESSAIFLTPWILMFDGSSTADGAGAGIVIISPAGRKASFSFFLDFKCSNNQAEYEALIIGLEILIEMAVRDNKEANSMAQAASGIRVPVGIEEQLIKITRRSLPSAELRNTMFDTWTIDIEDLADDDWRIPFIMFLRNPNIKADRSIKRKAINFVLLDGDLYRKGLEDGLLLQCISKEESLQVMAEVHEGSCGTHQAGIKMRWLIRRYGYYWPRMRKDCIDYSKGCQVCQRHGPIQNVPAKELQLIIKLWPFRGWGLDLIGKINPPSSEGHHWVIVATDYFTKWVEAKACKAVDQQTVINFMEQNIIHRFGIPETLVSDNVTVFRATDVLQFGHNMNIHMSASTPYYAQANGQAESSNKILIEIIEKMIKDKPRRWHETLSEALWAYRNSKRTGTGVTPYMLTYGHDAVLPMEMKVKSARVAFQNNLTPADYTQAMLVELEDLDEFRRDALDHIITHKKKVMRIYNKRVKPKSFAEEDLVWKVVLPVGKVDRKYGKWSQKWEGPYLVHQVLSGGAYRLKYFSGRLHDYPINGKYLKRYVPAIFEREN
ncbi:uncharacterized protein LOC132314258 [Cornus florida]|uniref:uncharacterized protein LOC132314258 n=1 Tax=Cornus florida TaxID=4283 RepID=UPI00289F0BDA|nr:uncharacterized protein LOC132314258 [Cornus florida]